MNDALKDQAAELIKNTSKTAMETVDFLKAQAPDVCQQYCNWYMVNHLFYASMLIFTCIALYTFSCKTYKWSKANMEDYHKRNCYASKNTAEMQEVLYAISLIISLVTIPFVIYNAYLSLLPLICPKIVILDLVVQLMSNKQVI